MNMNHIARWKAPTLAVLIALLLATAPTVEAQAPHQAHSSATEGEAATHAGAKPAEAPTPAGAGEPAAAASPGEGVEEIVIRSGIIGSLEAALDKKRNAEAIIDAISSEDVGKFPDENIAESLQRVPGVAITRGFGEGQDVSIRGLGRGRNLTLVNGQGLASSSFFLENFEFNRGFNYAMLPSELVAAVEIYKTPEAKLQEGGIGGTINLNTRRPLAQKKPLSVAGSLALGYSDLSNALDPRGTLIAGWKSPDGKFGILVGGVHQQRTLRRDAIEVLNYKRGDLDVGGDGSVDYFNVFYPAFVGSALFQQKRVRDSLLATAQYRPMDQLEFTLNGLYSRLAGNNTNDNYLVNVLEADVSFNPMTGLPSTVNNAEVRGDTAVFIGFNDDLPGPNAKKEVQLDTFMRQVVLRTYSLDLETVFHTGPWRFSNHSGITQATGGRGDVLLQTFYGDAPVNIDLRDGVGAVQFGSPVQPWDPSNPNLLNTFDTWRDNIAGTQQQIYTQLDGSLDLASPVVRSLEAGLRYRSQYQDRSRIFGRLFGPRGPYGYTMFQPGNAPFTALNQTANLPTPNDYLDGIAGPNGLTRYVKPNAQAGWNALPHTSYDFGDDPEFYFRIDEQVTAFYTQANLDSDLGEMRLRGNVGIRVANTRMTSRGRTRTMNQQIMPTLQKTNNTQVLPSLNLILHLNEEMIVRTAAARVMNRPGFTQISSAIHCHETVPTCTGGDPALNPFIADQVDLSGEWYYDRASALLLGAFYKRIKSFVGLREGAEIGPDGQMYNVTRPFNGGGGNTCGLEAAVQHIFDSLPAPYNGLGLTANYTYAASDSTTQDPQSGLSLPIPGQSKHSLNLVALYELDPVSVRFGYNYRTRFFEQIHNGGARFTDDFGQLDAKASVHVMDNVSLFVEGLNLTNTTLVRFVGDKRRPFQNLRTGRRVFAGVRGQY